MKKIALIGSCGSIGKQVIQVVLNHPDKFEIEALITNSSYKDFEGQINLIKPKYAVLCNADLAKRVANIPQATQFLSGEERAVELISKCQAEVVFVAAGGFAGLKYSLAAILAKKTLALANKETLVCAGDIIMPLARKMGVSVIPVDSEHSAIWQCLNFNANAPLKNLIITASGGAFRDYSNEQLKSVTPQQALNHPNWKMGKKITVDSATLLNKGFEVIEAHHLYSTPYSNIKTVLHKQSIVHSMVEFSDGSIMAQMGVPSMILPIQLALTYPNRCECAVERLSFSTAFSLDFAPLIQKDYPCYDLAIKCASAGGIMPCVLNGSGEVAVQAFLNNQISFLQISEVIDSVLQKTQNQGVESYSQLVEVDSLSRKLANNFIKR
ncbi:MAG: 1-deoxy-D-xylulose-5-phosphate reductoisomerase [Clostridiales bacterium]|nr:1-deoxy-D-xylulose-5-phosphate reductoisomerase [Clostridiales bacterium]